MSNNFSIGNYQIANKAGYDNLVKIGCTSNENLSLVDANKDGKISEDELAVVEIIAEEMDETAGTTSTNNTNNQTNITQNNAQNEKTKEEKIAELQEKYYKQIQMLEDQLDTLEEQRRQVYRQQSGLENSAEAVSEMISSAKSITDQINSIKTQVITLLTNMEDQIAKIEEAASVANSNGEYSINTSGVDIGAGATNANFNADFGLNLTTTQANDLQTFKAHYAQNKGRYEAVAKATGVPSQLIAAIHWREASGNFNSRLHDGGSLSGYSSWEAAAIDALSGNYGSIDPNNVQTWLDFAEHYNGMGYANKGLPSPYVWAGTTNYTSGKYVADGVFDAGYVDKQLGVAVMLQAIL